MYLYNTVFCMFEKRNHVPLRKKYIINIVDDEKEKIYTIEFTQCTARETIEFNQMSEMSKIKWIIDFINTNGTYHYPDGYLPERKKKHTEYQRKNIEIEYKNKVHSKVNEILSKNMEGIRAEIQSKAHKHRDTMYKDIHKALAKGEENRRGIFGVNLMNICKEFNIQ